MKYWVCQSCKSGQVDEVQPTKCDHCGKVGGSWKSSNVTNMGSFKLYECPNCHYSVEERNPPRYSCPSCGSHNWKIYNG